MYLWLKVFHLFFVIAWFAGLFYLPRFFVHHSQTEDANTQIKLSLMEAKLFRFMTVILIFMLFTALGLVKLNLDYYLQSGWFHAKLTLVFGLICYHLYCGRLVKQFRIGENKRSHVFYRVFNEVPTIVLLGILILVIIKPF